MCSTGVRVVISSTVVRVVIGGMVVRVVADDACVGVTTGISEALHVVSRPRDGCGVNAGLEGVVVRIWDSLPPKPPHRACSSWAEPNGQTMDDKLLRPMHYMWHSAIWSISSSTISKPHLPGSPQMFDPWRPFLRNRHCKKACE